MLERDAKRKYNLELGATMVLYVVVLFAALTFGKSMAAGAIRNLVLLTPVIPIALAVWAIARGFRRMDEFVRLRSLESVAIAATVTAGWTLTYGFLESAGFPRISMFWVWPVMGLVWGLHSCLRGFFSR
jgi:hypothetical protein